MEAPDAHASAPASFPNGRGGPRRWFSTAIIAVVSAGAAAASACIAVYTVYKQDEYHRALMKEQRELIQVQVTLELVKQFDSEDLRAARRGFAKELLTKRPSAEWVEDRVLNFFETLSLYSDQERVDVETVYRNFSHYIKYYWAASALHIRTFRDQEGDDEYYAGFQELQDSLAADESRNKGLPRERIQPSLRRIQVFLQGEASLPK